MLPKYAGFDSKAMSHLIFAPELSADSELSRHADSKSIYKMFWNSLGTRFTKRGLY